ncbi:hypothetical protein [Halobaculum marinum]|uniref:Uncharacterized protein n=1 Tax=Halobaculum marinum TaxID=3031996 RepID=A0ABD5WWB1_9EURY|nr:hypothetical protein [Halobaculum sp. DT55]
MVVITLLVVGTLLGLSIVLYSARVQRSEQYQALVVPLANIMDIGFVAMTPIIVLITGLDSPLTMLGLSAVGFAMGGVMRYNIRMFEPVADEKGVLQRVATISQASLIVASLVNVAYYLQLMAAVVVLLVVLPFGVDAIAQVNVSATVVIAVCSLVALGLIGYYFGLEKLNALGERTTAFNLAAIAAIIVGFLAYNVDVALAGNWSLPAYNPPLTSQSARQVIGFFAIVQGFEASRYLGEHYSAAVRSKTMRAAQIIAAVAFVLFPASALLLFAEVRPELEPIAVVQIAQVASPVLPWLILLLAVGSQASASVNAISSRSDVLIELTNSEIPRRFTYPMLALGAVAVVLVTDVLAAVAVASRVFAVFFALQCVIAVIVASRSKQWLHVVGIVLVGLAMVTIAIFGVSS